MTSSDFKWRQAAQAVDGMRIFRVKVGGYWTDEHWLEQRADSVQDLSSMAGTDLGVLDTVQESSHRNDSFHPTLIVIELDYGKIYGKVPYFMVKPMGFRFRFSPTNQSSEIGNRCGLRTFWNSPSSEIPQINPNYRQAGTSCLGRCRYIKPALPPMKNSPFIKPWFNKGIYKYLGT